MSNFYSKGGLMGCDEKLCHHSQCLLTHIFTSDLLWYSFIKIHVYEQDCFNLEKWLVCMYVVDHDKHYSSWRSYNRAILYTCDLAMFIHFHLKLSTWCLNCFSGSNFNQIHLSRGVRWTSLDASFAQCFAIFGNIVQNIARGTTDPWVDTITGGTS